MEIGIDAVGGRAVVVHGHALAVEVVVARFGAAGHFEERADVLGADAAARLLDPATVRIVKITFGGQAATANLCQSIFFIPGQGLLTAQACQW